MLRLPLTALSIFCLILLSCWSIWRTKLAPFFAPQPLATPTVHMHMTPTEMPTAAAVLPAPTSTLPALQVATGAVALPPFLLPLPADWRYVTLTPDHLREQGLQLAAASAHQELALHLPARLPNGVTPVVAWPQAQAQQVGLIAYVLPRETLTLEQYVAESGSLLRAQPTIILHRAEVNDTLHAEVPVAILHYTQRGVSMGAASGDRDGYQLVLFDRNADTLLLLTWLTMGPGEELADAQLLPTDLQAILDNLVR